MLSTENVVVQETETNLLCCYGCIQQAKKKIKYPCFRGCNPEANYNQLQCISCKFSQKLVILTFHNANIAHTFVFFFSLSISQDIIYSSLQNFNRPLFFLSKLFLKKCFLEPSKNLFNNNYCKLLATIFFKNFKIVSGTTFFCEALSFENFIMKYIHMYQFFLLPSFQQCQNVELSPIFLCFQSVIRNIQYTYI